MLPKNGPSSIKKTSFLSKNLRPKKQKYCSQPIYQARIHRFFRQMSQSSNSDSTVSREVVVKNQLGLHARPAAMFVKKATGFKSEILVIKDGEEVNGKSIMGLMMLAAAPGTTLTVTAEGSDATDALDELEKLVNSNFEEE